MNQEKEVVYVIGHKNPDTDSIVSAMGYAEYLNQRGSLPNMVVIPARAGEVNSETAFALEYFKADSPKLLDDLAGQKLILVDHTEKAHMADGVDQADILGVLDHHRVALIHHSPIFFHTEAVGSTATLVAGKFFKDEHLGITLTSQMAGLLLTGILSDTVIFRSSTTTTKDREFAKRLAEVARVYDPEKLGINLKKAGITGARSLEDLVTSGFKEWDMGGKKIGVSQIEVVDLPSILRKSEELQDIISKIYHRGSYNLVILMLTDILQVGTEILAVGETEALEKTFGKTLEGGSFYISGMISRKKDLIPPLTKALAFGLPR